MLSWSGQKGKLELQQLRLLLKPEPERLSLVACGLQSCSHLVAKFQITVHKPLHIPSNEHVRVQQCFICNGLLRLGNQYQIPIRGEELTAHCKEGFRGCSYFDSFLPPSPAGMQWHFIFKRDFYLIYSCLSIKPVLYLHADIPLHNNCLSFCDISYFRVGWG